MIISIKPHSSIQQFFRGTDLRIDVNTYSDVLLYLQSMHPEFIAYVKRQIENGLQETFSFLDRNLREITKDDMYMRRAREDDVIHIVPAIVGGGGKRGALAMIAMAALLVFLPEALPGVASYLGGITLAAGTATTAAVTALSVAQTIGLNLALMGITMLFTPKQKAAESSRDNDAFGSLVNTMASGTPISLNYGLVRVAGQLISGYIISLEGLSESNPVAQVVTTPTRSLTQTFTSSGSFVVPAGVTGLTASVVGGGGGYGSTVTMIDGSSSTSTGGGGGNGASTTTTTLAVTAGETLTVTIGALGTNAAPQTNDLSGSSSSTGGTGPSGGTGGTTSLLRGATTLVSAAGGSGGGGASSFHSSGGSISTSPGTGGTGGSTGSGGITTTGIAGGTGTGISGAFGYVLLSWD